MIIAASGGDFGLHPDRHREIDAGRQQSGGREDDEPSPRLFGLVLLSGVVEHVSRRVESRRTHQQVEQAPSAFEIAGGVVVSAVEDDPAVDAVGHEQDCDRGHHQVESRGTPPRPHGQADGNCHQDQIHQRVRHGDQFLCEGQSRILDVGRDQEYPGDGADSDTNDQRVDETRPVAARAAVANQEEDSRHQEGIHRQIEEVTDRGKGGSVPKNRA